MFSLGIYHKKVPEKSQLLPSLKNFIFDAISTNTNYTSIIEVTNKVSLSQIIKKLLKNR